MKTLCLTLILSLLLTSARAQAPGSISPQSATVTNPAAIFYSVPNPAAATSGYQWSLNGLSFGFGSSQPALTVTNPALTGTNTVQCVETTALGILTNTASLVVISTNSTASTVSNVTYTIIIVDPAFGQQNQAISFGTAWTNLLSSTSGTNLLVTPPTPITNINVYGVWASNTVGISGTATISTANMPPLSGHTLPAIPNIIGGYRNPAP